MSDNENSAYEKLTPARKALVDAVIKNLEKGVGLWEQGWAGGGVPVSGISGKQYNGINRMFLMAATAERGYSDNRWVTFKQMEDKGWSFKRDEEGKSRGKNAGVSIEYFELRDRQTKQPFDRHTLDGMTADERNDYMDENVYPIRKYYRVFNGDVIEGIPERERVVHDTTGRNDRAEALIKYWSETESPIKYGGSMAYYSSTKDEIHLPEKQDFVDMPEFYSTALHEIGHSTGHEKRLNRNLDGKFGSAEYAEEELRAEIASMFLECGCLGKTYRKQQCVHRLVEKQNQRRSERAVQSDSRCRAYDQIRHGKRKGNQERDRTLCRCGGNGRVR